MKIVEDSFPKVQSILLVNPKQSSFLRVAQESFSKLQSKLHVKIEISKGKHFLKAVQEDFRKRSSIFRIVFESPNDDFSPFSTKSSSRASSFPLKASTSVDLHLPESTSNSTSAT